MAVGDGETNHGDDVGNKEECNLDYKNLFLDTVSSIEKKSAGSGGMNITPQHFEVTPIA